MTHRRLAIIAWGAGLGIILAGALAQANGLRINTTASLPRGVWQSVGGVRALRTGDVVSFCPSLTAPILLARERGYLAGGGCPGNLEPMMKPVVALSGDRVVVSAFGVSVNGRNIPQSAPMATDSGGRLLPLLLGEDVVVPAGVLWVLSSHNSRSYDSRYFGPIPVDNVTATLRPLWTESAQ